MHKNIIKSLSVWIGKDFVQYYVAIFINSL